MPDKIIKSNYHTHTSRCKHAFGEDEQYVLSAIQGNFDVLGFSDHIPWPFHNNFVSNIRMGIHQIEEYVTSIRSLQQKYQDKIEIKLGFECEYYPEYINWLRDERERLNVDYLIFGNHYPYQEIENKYFGRFTLTPDDLKLYLECAVKGMETGLFNCLAHPDLFMRCYTDFDEHCEHTATQLAQNATRLGVALEFNYSLDYCHDFWKIIAQEQNNVIIGTDAHHYNDLEDVERYNSSFDRLLQLGITPLERLL